jgi:hypothetical protein
MTESNIRVKDPHVFPFVVKGFRDDQPLQLESRRTREEARQSADRFKAAGYKAFTFELKEIEGS